MTSGRVRLTVPAEAEGSRLDQFLARRVPGQTRSALRRLIREGRVLVQGRIASKPGLGLKTGARVSVEIPPPPPARPLPEAIPLEILHEDDALLVVVKPAGLPVHPGHGRREGTLVNALLGLGTPLSPLGGPDRPGIVHRLDRETSGLLIVAKTEPAQRTLTRSFARRQVDKGYKALVWGHPKPPEGIVERGVGRSRGDRTRMTTHAPASPRHAVTRYRTVRSMPGFAFLEIRIETGRTHQIRVHMQSIHHPVVGDSKYGGRLWKSVQDPVRRKALREFDRLALHASDLQFRHPTTGESLRFHAPLPEELRALLAVLEERS